MVKELKLTTQQEIQQFVSFYLANQCYGAQLIHVQEIIERPPYTRLPEMPLFIEGVMNLRGKIVPIIDLRKRFKLSIPQDDSKAKVMVAQLEDRSIGLVVDGVRGVVKLSADSLEPLPDTIRAVKREYLDGVGKITSQDGSIELLVLMNFQKILSELETGFLLNKEF